MRGVMMAGELREKPSRNGNSSGNDDDVFEGEATLSNFKPTKLYYRIGEVSRITGVKPYVLRYWETEFKWMTPQKSRSKQRLYRPKDIEMVFLIKKLLYDERFTIAGARQRLKQMGSDPAKVAAVAAAPTAESIPMDGARVRAELLRVRDELLALRAML